MQKGDFFKAWLPVIVWGILMFVGSTEVFSGNQTSRFITPFLLWIDPHMSYRTIEMVHILIRKSGHVFEYAVLAVLLWRAFRRGTPWQANLSILVMIVSVACSLFAISDEWHQSFVPSRTSSARDVLIDIGGALIGIGIYSVFTRRKPAAAFARMANSSEDRHPKIG